VDAGTSSRTPQRLTHRRKNITLKTNNSLNVITRAMAESTSYAGVAVVNSGQTTHITSRVKTGRNLSQPKKIKSIKKQ